MSGEFRSLLKALVRAPISGATWLATAHLALGFPLGLAGVLLIVGLGALTLGTAITVILPLLSLAALFAGLHGLSAAQRARFAALLDVHVLPPTRPEHSRWWRRVLATVADAATWQQLAFHLLSALLSTLGFALVAGLWGAALVLLPYGLRSGVLYVLGGVLALFTAPWVARGLAFLDARLAIGLLGPSARQELQERVDELLVSRAGLVEAVDAERRRIERDLHDGAQRRLTLLAMNLGLARRNAAELPEDTRQALVAAHEEAKLAVTELREFVRGLHPAVLEDRGLDAALSGIAAASPVPVELSVDLPVRPPKAVEAIAYFVVSEALTNVAKHARAALVRISVSTAGGTLRLKVTDDGRGGASVADGSGLRGLAGRVAAVDGRFSLESPQGRGTVMTVELPCG
ncbi:sensor histidine kinase [Pseudonocardiaceae bacterium YIM PH 21723]|nr:sensor histidine kinase [Pseudonocardiaceae bacterium YIM PH 21723]